MNKQTQKNLLDLVKRNYEEIAVDFDTTRKKYLWPELIKLASIVKDGDRILDVGCGNGRLIEAFKDKKINYLGVDNSEALIESARKNIQPVIASDRRERSNPTNSDINQRLLRRDYASRNDNNNFKFQVADILELDKFPEKDFDYIFCIAVLHHLPGDELRIKALEQMKNKLKPNGKIILTVWNLWSQKKFRRLIFKTFLEKMLLKSGLMSRRPDVSIGIPTASSELRDPDFVLRTSG
ncbi:MAG: class I SAM-dependent methyltransferase, partial [bacterium]|nr:class I SAM-dependent methyltransferase [bacterium]